MNAAVPYSFPLVNNSGLDLTQNSLRVLGFSVASQLFLQPDTATTLQWSAFPTALTLPAAITNGVNTIAWTGGLPPFSRVSVGDQVTGAGVPGGTTITAISATITLSQDATVTATNQLTIGVQLMVGGTATTGSNTINGLVPPPSTSSLRIGQFVTGTGIPSGTTLSQVNSPTQITLSGAASTNATYSGTSPLTFFVQLSGTTTSASQSVTLTGLSSTDQIAVNALVSGTNIPSGSVISQIDSVTITLSNAATATGTNNLMFPQMQSGTLTSGSPSITGLTSTGNLGVGYPVTGPGIPGGTTITQINSASEITISSPVTEAGAPSLTFPPPSGIIPSFGITQFTSFSFDPTVQTAGLDGARIYFFVVPSTWPAIATQSSVAGYPTNPPGFPYAWSATSFGVQQPNNPPNTPSTTSSYPPFAIVEPTIDPEAQGGALHIDVQTVDGFTFPLSLTLQDGDNNQLGQVGQPIPGDGIDRSDIISAFQETFPSSSPYAVLLYGNSDDINGQYPGILNPGAYLADGGNPDGALNTTWNNVLKTLFTGIASLNMIGDDGAYYQGKPARVGTSNVLEFIGYTDPAMTQANGNKFHIYSAVTPDPLAPNGNLSPGYQVFANDGVFADASTNVIVAQNGTASPTPAQVVMGLERDIVCALNRGIALLAPNGAKGRTAGDTSMYWGTESNWYPYGITDTDPTHAQNQFSLFMHTAMVGGVTIFTLPPSGGPQSSIAASPAGATESGTTVTLSTSTAHNLVVNQFVTITGVGVAGYNGTVTVTGTPTATSFTYTAASSGMAASGGGMVVGGAVPTPQGSLMSQAYGFAYDENPVHGPALGAHGGPPHPVKRSSMPRSSTCSPVPLG